MTVNMIMVMMILPHRDEGVCDEKGDDGDTMIMMMKMIRLISLSLSLGSFIISVRSDAQAEQGTATGRNIPNAEYVYF